MIIKPQPGFQEKFLSTKADIAIGGGAAGSGKTFALVIEPIRHLMIPGFNAIFFRRTYPQMTKPGAIWDESLNIYPAIGGKPNESDHSYKFGATKFSFSHLQHEKHVKDHQGAQYCYIAFDEVTQFTEKQFMGIVSRNRSTSGIRPYIRATCNPDPESWIADFIAWWIDQETGFPIEERSGVLRYYAKDNDAYVWGDSEQEVIDTCPHLYTGKLKDVKPKSVTFIPGNIHENQILLQKDPGYLANLMSLSEEEQLRLLHGNWKIKLGGDVLINYVKLKDSFTNDFVKSGRRCITADIAFYGSDDFIAGVWDGRRLIDYKIFNKSGPEFVEQTLKDLATQYSVARSNIVYDADGLGAYLKGYLRGAKAFHGGAVPVKQAGRKVEYKNLKAQCYYLFADAVKNDEYYLRLNAEDQRRILNEYRAIKRDKPDLDGKLSLIKKDQMKNIIGGKSPDLLDMMMMRELLEIKDDKIRISTA